MTPLLAAIGCMVAIVVAMWQGRQSSSYGQVPPYVGAREYVEPFYTLGELREIAEGSKASDGSLTRAVLKVSNEWLVRPPGDEFLVVQFHAGEGVRAATRRYGWPVSLVTTHTTIDYASLPEGRAVPPQHTRIETPHETYWNGWWITTVGAPNRWTSQRDQTSISVAGFAAILIFPLAAWHLAGLALRLSRWRALPRARRNVVRATAAAAAASTLAILSLRPQEDTSARPDFFLSRGVPNYGSLPQPRVLWVTYRRLLEMAANTDSDQRLASALVSEATENPDWLLCASFVEDSSRVAQDLRVEQPWPLLHVHKVQRWHHPPVLTPIELGSVTAVRNAPLKGAAQLSWPDAGAVVRRYNGQLQIALPRSAPTTELRAVMINIEGVLLFALVVWLVWLGARLMCERHAARVAARRANAGQCVVCGYSLEALN